MTEKLGSLVLDALDDLDRIVHYRQLLEIALEELDKAKFDRNRIDVLLELFLTNLECHADNLRSELNQIQKIARRVRNNHCQRSQPEDYQGDSSNQQTVPGDLPLPPESIS
uniref:Uncharacterized protein n=1 Tax=Tolypothrix bouteillei VB521301 TaxID=1479485 RepID=A0A0C1R2E9_9CYAN